MDNHPKHRTNSFTFPAMSPDMEIESELADHLFSNGKFLLHTFPIQPKSYNLSRTSSVSSKDSLVSSRSNSTNSRTSSSSSSSCSSARTSTSEASAGVAMNRKIFPEKGSRSPVHYSNNYHIPPQRWQFMAPVPILNRRTSYRRRGEENRIGSPEKKKCSLKKGYCQRFFRWVVSTCKRCHAMEP